MAAASTKGTAAAMADPAGRRWLILAVLFVARGAWAYQFQAVGSVGPMILDDLGIGYAELGTLIGLFDAPGIVVALAGGYLGQRYGDKRLVLIGLGLMVAGGVAGGASQDFEASAVARVVAGAGSVLLGILVAKMVADWFAGRELALAMAVVLASWPIGIGAALATQGALAEALGWPAVFYAAAAASLLGLVLVLAFYRPPPDAQAAGGAAGSAAVDAARIAISAREVALVSIAALVWVLFNAGLLVLVSFGPTLLESRGFAVAEAGQLISLSTWAYAAATLAGGAVAEWSRRPDLLMAASFAAMAAALALVPYAAFTSLLFIAIGIATGAPTGAVMALSVEALDARNRSVGMGVFYAWRYGGFALLQPFAGWTADVGGDPAAPVLFAALCVAAALAALAGFRLLQRAT